MMTGMWTLLADAGVDLRLVHVDPLGGYTLTRGDLRVCWGPATTETGAAVPGWDYTLYRDDKFVCQDWVEADSDLMAVLKEALSR